MAGFCGGRGTNRPVAGSSPLTARPSISESMFGGARCFMGQADPDSSHRRLAGDVFSVQQLIFVAPSRGWAASWHSSQVFAAQESDYRDEHPRRGGLPAEQRALGLLLGPKVGGFSPVSGRTYGLTRMALRVRSRVRVSAARARVFEGTGVLVAQRAIAGGGLVSIVRTCSGASRGCRWQSWPGERAGCCRPNTWSTPIPIGARCWRNRRDWPFPWPWPTRAGAGWPEWR